MAKSTKRSKLMRKLTASVVGVLLLSFFFLSVAFPGPWNQVLGSALPLNDEPFRLGLDLQGGAHLVYEADMTTIPESDRANALEGVRDVIERRVNAYGVSEPVVQTNIQGDHYRVIVELAGVFDISDAIQEIGETPILEFKTPLEEVDLEVTDEQQAEIDSANTIEREDALAVLDRAFAGEDFSVIAGELSVDITTAQLGGYIGFIDDTHPIFDGLADEFASNRRLQPGVVDGLYEGTSSIHIVNYLRSEAREEVLGSHILLCHQDSEGCTNDRTKIEAQLLAQELLSNLTKENFAEVAEEQSDDTASATVGGSLDWVTRGMMVEPFENALFDDLSDGEISELVETQFGYHLIFREDTRSKTAYEIAHIEMPWTTAGDVLSIDPWENTELSGGNVRGASVAFDQFTGTPFVVLDFDAVGGELFGQITEANIGEVIGIFLDGEAISTPIVQQAIYGGEATITGGFTLDEAKLLAQRLNAGALPVPIDLLSQRTVGPTLGQVSLDRSIQAAIAGLILVTAFMILYYRLAGVIAVLALGVYTVTNLALYKWLGVTLSLASIAGFILSIGMAVDANVLIFERLKEELRSGRDLPSAINEGFKRAWTSIRDGNATTLIAAIILFAMSTSFVKGFALTLALGIIISMLTAVLVTRVFLKFASQFKLFQKPWLYNGDKKKK
ncbi:MAG: protein translocase subunit SecD [bacterium]|nr:protein translocase subunit SecD [bacterium]MDA1024465.1 protein translocase subunit SecD [bacterium]